MLAVVFVLLLGPGETIAGKYVQHSAEYLERYPARVAPLPAPLPSEVDSLCRLIEAGRHDHPELFAALGEALFLADRKELAYRAFHRAHRLRPKDAAWGRRMQARKDACPRVSNAVIAEEEKQAAFWVGRRQEFERDRLARGEDPDDLTLFYERYGRPEADLRAHARARRFSWTGGVVGLLIGVAFGAASRRVSRRVAALPLAVAALCLAGPALVGQAGLFYWGAAFATAGAIAVLAFGKRRA
ncbi:MAG: hypothetical protein ACYTDU_12200 [Planctomycetota bacterium]